MSLRVVYSNGSVHWFYSYHSQWSYTVKPIYGTIHFKYSETYFTDYVHGISRVLADFHPVVWLGIFRVFGTV
jgi:hypothetical protein